MRSLIIALALLNTSLFAAAQNDATAGLKVSGRGRLLVLTRKGESYRVNLGDQISAAKLDDVKLLLTARRGAHAYVVVAACGPSKLRPDDRQCGAGVECDLVWIKLDAAWRAAASKAVRYESCWAPVTSAEGYKISGGRLELESDDFREQVSRRVAYDNATPEKGFQIEERAQQDVP